MILEATDHSPPCLTFCIDPGHGGPDRGAKGAVLDEASLVLELAKGIVADGMLRFPDCRFVLTRDNDLFDPTLRDRNELALSVGCDVVLAIHANANTTPQRAQRGGVALYWPGNTIGQRLAETTARAFPEPLWTQRRGPDQFAWPATETKWPRARKVLEAYRMTSVLIEVGYLDNPHDERHLAMAEVQDEMRHAILAAVGRYRSLTCL